MSLTFECLPKCLRPIADYLEDDELDNTLIIFTLIGALSAVGGHLANEVSVYKPGATSSMPITVNNIILAESGAGKGRICNVVFGEIKNYIQSKIPEYENAMKKYRAEVRKIGKFTAKANTFQMDEDELILPDEPISPNFFKENFTIEGLVRAYHIGANHIFIFSDEGGAVTSCRAFQDSSLSTTLTLFNKITCGEMASDLTVKDGEKVLINKRMTMLLLIQKCFYDEMIIKFGGLASSGTYQRMFPIRTKSKRALMANKKNIHKHITHEYNQAQRTLIKMLQQQPFLNENGYLNPVKIYKTPDAHNIWFNFFSEQNDFCALNPQSEAYSFKVRIAETASRYATLFQLGDNFFYEKKIDCPVTPENMIKAVEICQYGLTCQLNEFVYRNLELEKARELCKFIGNKIYTRRYIMQHAPREFRQAKDLDRMLLFLLEEGLIEKTDKGFKRL